jgi:hypothetical protein
MMGWYHDGWGWGSGVGMLLMLLVWGALIALGIWAVARLTRGSGSAGDAAADPGPAVRQR